MITDREDAEVGVTGYRLELSSFAKKNFRVSITVFFPVGATKEAKIDSVTIL